MGKHKELTPPMKTVADEYLKHGNVSKAGRIARPDIKDVSARSYAVKALQSDTVREYLKNQSLRSAENITRIANLKQDSLLVLNANKDILDRAGYKPEEAIKTPTNGDTNGNQQAYLMALLKAIESGDTVALERIVLNPS